MAEAPPENLKTCRKCGLYPCLFEEVRTNYTEFYYKCLTPGCDPNRRFTNKEKSLDVWNKLQEGET